ncbi:MAG: carbon-nitrogen hydrolase family protein [bacterium]
MSTKVAILQTTSGDEVARNLAAAAAQVEAAAARGAKLIALPECFALMPRSRAQLRERAEVYGDGEIQRWLAHWSRAADVWIIAGSVPLRSDDPMRVFNALLVHDPRGENVARYDKIHLFDAALSGAERYAESDYTMPGRECVVQPTAAGAIGLSVCYDLRFPEMYRRLAALGATVLAVPSAFALPTGAAHWEVLLRARAIENACYVIAPAQVGVHPNGRRTYGHSLIIDPWGEVIAQRADGVGAIFAEIDLRKVERARTKLPSLTHRRLDLFN